MLGRVEPKDLLAQAGARINRPQVLAPLHLPDGGHLTFLFDGVIGDLFRTRRRRRLFLSAWPGCAAGGRGVLLWHGFLNVLLSSFFSFLYLN